uniref:POU domain protein ZP-23 n=1 Tax=Magallana gigas TaxID=29159 RepID=K1PQK3_MAGGI|eukprot:XP_011443043.1 PREDICTED: barH-like 2 homeobox protein [Crassostrea gigas]
MERFPPYKVLQLESSFHKSPYPSHTEIQGLSETLNEKTQRIKTWFRNRRTKAKRILGQMSPQTGNRVHFQIKKGKYVWKARPSSTSSVTNPNLSSSRGKISANQRFHAVCQSPSSQSKSPPHNTFQNQAIRSNKSTRDVNHMQRAGSGIEGKVRPPLVAIEPPQPSAETGDRHDEIVDPEYWEMMKEIGLQ